MTESSLNPTISAAVLLQMLFDMMTIKDKRLSVEIMMCLLVSSSKKLQAFRIAVSSALYIER